jgi:hypothetical protein
LFIITRDFFKPEQNKNGEWRFMVPCYTGLCKTCGLAKPEPCGAYHESGEPCELHMFAYMSVHTSKCQFHPGICQHVSCRKAWEKAIKRAVKKRAQELQASYRIGSCGAATG